MITVPLDSETHPLVHADTSVWKYACLISLPASYRARNRLMKLLHGTKNKLEVVIRPLKLRRAVGK